MTDIVEELNTLMQKVRDGEDRMFPGSLMSRAATIARAILTDSPAVKYTWEDIRRDFQPRNADLYDRRNFEAARGVALSNIDYWIRYDGDEIRNIELASALSTLMHLHRDAISDANATRLLMRDIQDQVMVA